MSFLDTLLNREQCSLRLYHMDYCYYCEKVRRAADKLGIQLELLDVYSDGQARERLRKATGRSTVPVLGILDETGNEKFMPESEDIIEYLRGLERRAG